MYVDVYVFFLQKKKKKKSIKVKLLMSRVIKGV